MNKCICQASGDPSVTRCAHDSSPFRGAKKYKPRSAFPMPPKAASERSERLQQNCRRKPTPLKAHSPRRTAHSCSTDVAESSLPQMCCLMSHVCPSHVYWLKWSRKAAHAHSPFPIFHFPFHRHKCRIKAVHPIVGERTAHAVTW